ncbi:dTDP-4-dehydrorhamnose reductase [Azovibrio restrictus]|uniref:dTDP-4-dehydrorhamnose reductase n=1 Tax=Azovibrio restrictus TaxID=146938 RepID=UPI0026EDAB01|nr:dTDP-4-dehydrorhamnose reductase [Azovibrio restrictus]
MNGLILLTGVTGQVGFELQRALAPLGPVAALDRQSCDLGNGEALLQKVRELRPAIIVNPAAYTAVDRAESEPDLAMAINAVAPGLLGQAAAELGALVVHYSTDYVFDGGGTRPYVETDQPKPLSVYGRSKLAGELALQASGARHLILRTSWVFGAFGGNFAKTMLRLAAEREQLKVVADQFGAPTSAALIADVTAQILGQYLRCGSPEGFPLGLYHLAAAGETNWHEYAATVIAAARRAGRPLKLAADGLLPIPGRDYPTPAPRPANSRLDTRRLRETFGLELPDWRQGLDHVLQLIL